MGKQVAGFEPKPMKISVLTAALQELTPREKRDPDPDLAIEEWLRFSSDIGSPYIELSTALHPSVSDVPAEAMLDPVANTLDSSGTLQRETGRARQGGDEGDRRRAVGPGLFRQHAGRRRRGPPRQARIHAARFRRGRAAGDRRRVRIRRPQLRPGDGPQPGDVRGGVHPAAKGGQGAGPDLSRGAVPDAGMERRWTAGTTTSPTRRGRGSRCTASARSTAWETSSVSTTIRPTPC